MGVLMPYRGSLTTAWQEDAGPHTVLRDLNAKWKETQFGQGKFTGDAAYGVPRSAAAAAGEQEWGPMGSKTTAGGSEQMEFEPKHRLEGPEILKIAQALMGGRLPKLEKALGRALGRFVSRQTHPKLPESEDFKIELLRDLWKGPLIASDVVRAADAEKTLEKMVADILRDGSLSPEDIVTVNRRRRNRMAVVMVFRRDEDYVNRILAHEIGHLWNYLPHGTMDSGNILGRIASVAKPFQKHTLGYILADGTITKPLSTEDRQRLMEEARQQLKDEKGSTPDEIIEEIIREVPIFKETKLTPDDIKKIWNSVEGGKDNPGLYDFMAGLSGSEKKAILIKAMRGLVDERLKQFAGREQVGTRKVVEKRIVRTGEEENLGGISERFKKLVEEEIERRRLFDRDTITAELKALTLWWHPFNPSADRAYTKYRHSSRELYADAISVLFNNPAEFHARAPSFSRGLFNWLEKKPEVRKAYFDAHEALASGGALNNRVQDLYDMQERAGQKKVEQEIVAQEKGKVSFWRSVVQEMFAREEPIWRAKKRYKEVTGEDVDPSADPLYRFEEIPKMNARTSVCSWSYGVRRRNVLTLRIL